MYYSYKDSNCYCWVQRGCQEIVGRLKDENPDPLEIQKASDTVPF